MIECTQLIDSKSNIEDKDPYSALFVLDDLFRLLADSLEVVVDLCLGAVDDELHVGDGQCFRVHHKLLCNLSDFTS